MKENYDRKSVACSFQSGDCVLVLLPIVGAALQAKFSGLYVVDRKLSETDYLIQTPDRKETSHVTHINMLKAYLGRNRSDNPSPSVVPVVSVAVLPSPYNPSDDRLQDRHSSALCARFKNSEILANLGNCLAHLSGPAKTDVETLIQSYPELFGDVPTPTTLLKHDIDVGNHKPIKQHAYCVNPNKRAIMRQEAQYLLDHGFAVPSSSSWSSPPLLVPKSDQTPPFCNDFSKVNAITKPDSFPLPRMDDCVDRVREARFVTKLDFFKGYWQVPLT